MFHLMVFQKMQREVELSGMFTAPVFTEFAPAENQHLPETVWGVRAKNSSRWTCPGTTDTRTLRTIDPQKEVLSARGNATVSARV